MIRRPSCGLVVLVFAFVLAPMIARSDEVRLKNGSVFRGKVVKEDEKIVVIKTSDGEMSFPRRQVEKVVRERPAGGGPAGSSGEGTAPAGSTPPAVRVPADPGAGSADLTRVVGEFRRAIDAGNVEALWSLLGAAARTRMERWAADWSAREGMDYDGKEPLDRFFVQRAKAARAVGHPTGHDLENISAVEARLTIPPRDSWKIVVGQEGGVACIVEIAGPTASPGGGGVMGMLDALVTWAKVFHGVNQAIGGQGWYWMRDVAGLAHLDVARFGKLTVFPPHIARADRVGHPAYSVEPPQPVEGYWVRSVARDEQGQTFVTGDWDRDGKLDSHPSRLAVCAYPAQYGGTSTWTYLADHAGGVWRKDLGADVGEGVEQWPAADPAADGWERVK